MANSILIQVRGDTAANWSSKNPILKDREQGYDKTNNVLKIGDGSTAWNSLPATPEIVNALNSTKTSAALSAAQGKALADRVTTLENKPAGTTVTVTDNLTSTSTTAALSANQGRVLNSKIPTVSTATNSTSTTTAASSSAVKAAYDLAQSAYNKAGSSVSLSDSTSSTSSTTAASSYAVKKAYDRANEAYNKASSSSGGGLLSYVDSTYGYNSYSYSVTQRIGSSGAWAVAWFSVKSTGSGYYVETTMNGVAGGVDVLVQPKQSYIAWRMI